MEENKREVIRLEATEIMKRITASRLYGEVIDPKDFDQAIVAAYYLGNTEASQMYEKMRDIDKLFK